ncbi:MAG: nucleotidyltransferase domain-containing protein [Acholeplasmataceae bacterium]
MNNNPPIVKMKFGSVLYGTNTPESDTDIKGIFLPTYRDCLLNRISKCRSESTGPKHAKNTNADTDEAYYSLQYFMQLLREGQVVALDMLFCPPDKIISNSTIWSELIYPARHSLIGRNMRAFMGYCRTQTHKYGVKGSRIAAIRHILELVDSKEGTKLNDIYEELPETEHVLKYFDPISKQNTLEVCGRKFQGMIPLQEMAGCLKRILENYGHRAKQAEQNKNIDWKAVSHAFRVCYEALELLTTGNITFPLKQAEFLKQIKQGKLHYSKDGVPDKLDALIAEVQDAASLSTLPEQAEQSVFDELILSCYSTITTTRTI